MSASNRKASTCQQQHGSRLAEAAQPENFWKSLQDAVLRWRRRQIRESDTDGAPRFQENNASHPRTVRAGARNRAGVRLKGDRRQCGMREAAAASGGAAQPRAVRQCRALPAHRPTDPPARPSPTRPATPGSPPPPAPAAAPPAPPRLTAPQHQAQPPPRSPLCSPRKTSLNFRSGLPNSPPLPGADMAARRGRAGAVTEEKKRPPSTHRHRRPARRPARHFRRRDGVTSAAAAMASPTRHSATWRWAAASSPPPL